MSVLQPAIQRQGKKRTLSTFLLDIKVASHNEQILPHQLNPSKTPRGNDYHIKRVQ